MMRLKPEPYCLILLLAALLLACSPSQNEVPEPELQPEPVTAVPYAEFDTTASIRDIMQALIIPNADVLWGSVQYILTEEKVEEHFPQTDAEWARLQSSAIALLEGANSLMILGRQVAPAGATAASPSYQREPEEIAELLQQDPDSWISFAQSLQFTVMRTQEAIEERDIPELTEMGAIINQACEACHSQYWYKQF